MTPTSLLRNLQPIVLASGSPRRQEFFHALGLAFSVQSADIDETMRRAEDPDGFARRLARDKARAVIRDHDGAVVVGADTVVVIDDRVLGKPRSREHALDMLRTLRGRSHRVITGLALVGGAGSLDVCTSEITEVEFAPVPDELLSAYVRTGEPLDKAGGYGIQGMGGVLVRRITGSCSNVIGLPLERLVHLFIRHGVAAPANQPA